MTAPLRVLHVVRGLANSSGITHMVIPLAEAQARHGCRVSVFHVAKPTQPSLSPDPDLVEGLCFPMTVRLNNPGLSWPFARAVDRRIREFDVVHVQAVFNFPTWWTMRAAHRAGVPYMVAPQGSFHPWALSENGFAKRIYGSLTEGPLLAKASRMQALTPNEEAQFLVAGLRAPAVVIPNGVNPGDYRGEVEPLASALGLPHGEKTVLFLSRIHAKKGLDILLHAFRELRRTRKVTLVVAGADAGSGYMAEMQGLARSLGVAGHTRFIGEVKGPEKIRILMGTDAYALLSRSEGHPVAVLEALGAGRPTVLTTECHLPEVEAADAGWVVPPDAAAGAAALEEIFADPALAARRGANARRLVEEKFTWSGIARLTMDAYREMVDEARARNRN